ncbi:MAG: S1/P1 nuclease [Ferruginibacter sp.]
MKRGITISVLLLLMVSSQNCLAWGKKGHELVAQIAFHYLDDSTKKIVKDFLGNLSIEEAANWMDDERSNDFYNYMRTWHYVNVEKGETYKPSKDRDIVTVLHSAIQELKNYKNLSKKDIKRDLLLIFHLVGDLHQPLHTGYGSDKGGNTIDVSSPALSGNLHVIWDTQIIENRGITLDSCLKFYPTLTATEIKQIQKIDVLAWMNGSRSLLDSVYNFQNSVLPNDYTDRNVPLIEKQLLFGGLRLAAILNAVFAPAKAEASPAIK